jgi:hypothetical protein
VKKKIASLGISGPEPIVPSEIEYAWLFERAEVITP